jgi:biofilm PGA synthesis N-glycosyltransferase PgaC
MILCTQEITMKYSLIITAWKEPDTVARTISNVLDLENLNLLPEMEIVLATPDEDTKIAAENIIKKYNFKDFLYVRDPHKGKPFALNLALEKASGEILIMTDGDVIIQKNALKPLVAKLDDTKIGAVTSRPVSADSRNSLFGYFGHLLADVAHKRRSEIFASGGFYFVSGYLYAMKNLKVKFPEDSLSDDAWITLKILDLGYKVSYSPESTVAITYPKNFQDWIKQKRRSLGGYTSLKSYQDEVIKKVGANKSLNRKFTTELSYIFFPITYAKNPKELVYSLFLYPARLWLWIEIWWSIKIKKKTIEQIWQRVESTK